LPAKGRQASAGLRNASNSFAEFFVGVNFRVSIGKNKYNYGNYCNIIQFDAD